MLAHERSQTVQLCPVEDTGEWIIGIAEQEHLGVRLRTGDLEFRPVKCPAPVGENHLELERVTLGEDRRRHERRVNGDRGDNGLARLARAADGRVDSGHQRAHERDPLGLDLPAMLAAEMTNDGVEDLIALRGIAEDAMLGPSLDRLGDGRRRLEIHVGDPTRDDVTPGILVPLGTVGPSAFRSAVEIKSHV